MLVVEVEEDIMPVQRVVEDLLTHIQSEMLVPDKVVDQVMWMEKMLFKALDLVAAAEVMDLVLVVPEVQV